MSSRSLGLFCGFFVSQGRSSPASCRLSSSGSSVRNRIRPDRRTVAGRFSTFLFSKASITESPHAVYPSSILRRWEGQIGGGNGFKKRFSYCGVAQWLKPVFLSVSAHRIPARFGCTSKSTARTAGFPMSSLPDRSHHRVSLSHLFQNMLMFLCKRTRCEDNQLEGRKTLQNHSARLWEPDSPELGSGCKLNR